MLVMISLICVHPWMTTYGIGFVPVGQTLRSKKNDKT